MPFLTYFRNFPKKVHPVSWKGKKWVLRLLCPPPQCSEARSFLSYFCHIPVPKPGIKSTQKTFKIEVKNLVVLVLVDIVIMARSGLYFIVLFSKIVKIVVITISTSTESTKFLILIFRHFWKSPFTKNLQFLLIISMIQWNQQMTSKWSSMAHNTYQKQYLDMILREFDGFWAHFGCFWVSLRKLNLKIEYDTFR